MTFTEGKQVVGNLKCAAKARIEGRNWSSQGHMPKIFGSAPRISAKFGRNHTFLVPYGAADF